MGPNIEVINLASSASTCQNPPNFRAQNYAAIGGLWFKGNPILCGGFHNSSYSNKCYSLENNEWVSSDIMKSIRVDAAATKLKDGKLLVTGGIDGSGGFAYPLKSAELLTEDGWVSNIPSLPVTISYHCIVTVNSTTVMVIGGYQNNQYSRKTFYFNFGEASWTKGPELKNKRGYHSCGKIRRDKESQEMSIIVAVGYNGSYLSSVEILDEGSNKWQTGPDLPFGIRYSQMVEDQNRGVVLIGGESSSVGILDTLNQLPHGGQDVWIKMEQKMQTGRKDHTAFLVPDNVVDCS
jgi:N-acetylneuraminic acid mutarotase